MRGLKPGPVIVLDSFTFDMADDTAAISDPDSVSEVFISPRHRVRECSSQNGFIIHLNDAYFQKMGQPSAISRQPSAIDLQGNQINLP